MDTPSKQPVEDSPSPDIQSEGDGVVIPEEFQKKVHALVHKAPKPHLDHISDRVNARRDEIRQQEMAKQPKGGKSMNYSGAEMPS
jgi:hypothetical protein